MSKALKRYLRRGGSRVESSIGHDDSLVDFLRLHSKTISVQGVQNVKDGTFWSIASGLVLDGGSCGSCAWCGSCGSFTCAVPPHATALAAVAGRVEAEKGRSAASGRATSGGVGPGHRAVAVVRFFIRSTPLDIF
eukprot:1352354-Amorphochlora_amoeboformis.AAC.1